MEAGFNPDNPPWGVAAAALVWVASIVLMVFVPLVTVLPYLVYRMLGTGSPPSEYSLQTDPNVLFVSIVGTIPAHILTLVVVWAVVTGGKVRRPFWRTIGWGWGRHFGLLLSVGAAVVLLVGGGLVAYFLGGEKTPFERMLESSAAARFATAFLATATAPLVEELVYRGVMFPAFRRALGTVWAVLIVAALFSAVHVSQYYNNAGVIAAVSMLGLALTLVRAYTGRVLPCFVIHLVFNAVQVAILIFDYFNPGKPAGDAQAGLFFY